MKEQTNKYLKIVFSAIGGLLVLLIAGGFWLYTGTLTAAKTALFKALPYPLALVNGRSVSMGEFLFRFDVAKKMSGADVIAQNQAAAKRQIYGQLVNEEETRQVAAAHNVSVSQKEIDDEYAAQALQADPGGKQSFEQLIAGYGLSTAQFKSKIIEPRLLASDLQVWFNGQKELNKDAYAKAEAILKRLQNGENMVILAVGLTEDDTERGTGGDLGFVDPSALLQELREPVASMKVGDVKIIPSRFGLHIIKVEEQNANKVHLREIFIKTSDYNQWFQNQIKNFSVRQLVKI